MQKTFMLLLCFGARGFGFSRGFQDVADRRFRKIIGVTILVAATVYGLL